jgi:site-specific DNA-methyltransferase (adenine-specific)
MASEIKLYNRDCMEAMKEMPDKAFDLAIVDPPYGDTLVQGGYCAGKGGGVAKNRDYNNALWKQKAPDFDYFNYLKRVSKNQIIWGANHFGNMPPSSCWVVWDKVNGKSHFADCELAYCSFETTVRKFEFMWSGMLQQNMKEKEHRIHPTQKPVQLYKWLLQNYAKEGDKILDTHLGSGSIAIACYDMGFDLTGYEIDADYYNAAVKRLENHKKQLSFI